MIHKDRYTGIKWTIVFGSYENVEAFAVDEMQRMVQLYVPYLLEILPQANETTLNNDNLIVIGT